MDITKKYIIAFSRSKHIWEPKTKQIESIERNANGKYSIVFKPREDGRRNKPLTYNPDHISFLTERYWYAPNVYSIKKGEKFLYDIKDIWRYPSTYGDFWRIEFISESIGICDYSSDDIEVFMKCSAGEKSTNVFEYIKEIADLNPLGKDGQKQRDEEIQGILSKQYRFLKEININTVSALYLDPNRKIGKNKCRALIFPFGCNMSQKRAVHNALTYQLSVIQGPPGTGKTQTILNIIANLLMDGKSILVVSSNNSATKNVAEKLGKEGLDFFVASLGSDANKDEFIDNQPALPSDISSWGIQHEGQAKSHIKTCIHQLDEVFKLQNRLMVAKQELREIELEWSHFKKEVGDFNGATVKAPSTKILHLWLKLQKYAETDYVSLGFVEKIISRINWSWFKIYGKYFINLKTELSLANLIEVISELQSNFYPTKINELKSEIAEVSSKLDTYNSDKLMDSLKKESMRVLKSSLSVQYAKDGNREVFVKDDIKGRSEDFLKQYPVVLSTTFSARNCMSQDTLFDYIIMDEASQVSIETGFLALTCARNAVIVGDLQQLPNVVTTDDKKRFQEVYKRYKIPSGYNCADNSLLSSLCSVIANVPQQQLSEHYRCHPKIINYCNQKFYGGKLVIMTEDHGEEDVLLAVKSPQGNHKKSEHYNQREIDIIEKEIMPKLQGFDDIGVITPYKEQVEYINRHFEKEDFAATVHKYQGRENDVIIMSTVDDTISDFCDDSNMVNVAVSRAVKKFCLTTTGNEQKRGGNISDLLDYIRYNRCEVLESNLHSIFDYMYDAYSKEREAFLSKYKKVSSYVSENLTYALISKILEENPCFSHIKVVSHIPLRHIFDTSKIELAEERDYANHSNTHTDFLLVNKVTKLPIIAIETDGSDHLNNEEQKRRDRLKDSIFKSFGIPLLRLSTSGYGEEQKILSELQRQSSASEIDEIKSSNDKLYSKLKDIIESLSDKGIKIIDCL